MKRPTLRVLEYRHSQTHPWYLDLRPFNRGRKFFKTKAEGTTQKLTKLMASRLFSLISTSESSLVGLLSLYPEFPPYRDLARWRKTQPWFAAGWKLAKQMQAEWLMQKALDLQKNATRETAHLVRVRFDVIKYIASRLHPEVWGNRPAASPNISTTVQIGVISQERIAELRSSLDATRAWLQAKDGAKASPKELLPAHSS